MCRCSVSSAGNLSLGVIYHTEILCNIEKAVQRKDVYLRYVPEIIEKVSE